MNKTLKEKYIIKFDDGTFLKKGMPKYYRNGTSVIEQVTNISDARIFNDYSKAENVWSELVSIVFMKKCEIEVKP